MQTFKMYEYFAFKINDEWLSPSNVERFVIAPWFAAHKYKLKGNANSFLDVNEILFAPDDLSAIVVLLRLRNNSNAELPVRVEAEVAVNIRRKNEEFNLRKYETAFEDKRKCVIVKSEDDVFVCFGTDFKDGSLDIVSENINFYKEHYPSGELQRCFIPATYMIEFVLAPEETYYLPFVFSAGFSKKECLDSLDVSISNWRGLLRKRVKRKLKLLDDNYFICDSHALTKLFGAAVMNLDDFLCSVNGASYLRAGYPWFLEAWSRDDLWSCLGLISLGLFDQSASIMKFFTRFRMHRIPCTVAVDKKKMVTSYHGAGVDPLYLIVLDYLKSMSGKKWKDLSSVEKEILRHLVLENYLVVHGPRETWMDSIERRGTAVEIQGMWAKAMENRDDELAKKLKKVLKNRFWNRELMYPFDSYSSIPDGSVTPNCFVPAILGLYSKKELEMIIRKARSELECEYGIRTLSCRDKNYDPSGYHTGSSWGLTTLWGAALYIMGDKVNEGIALLEKLAMDLDRLHLGFVAEAWNSETGQCIGATAQLWSTALVPYVIDHHLLGIRWDEENNMLVIAPKMPAGWKKMRRGVKNVRSASFTLEMSRVTNGYELVIDFDRKGDILCTVVLPPGTKKLFVNGKQVAGRAATFKPKKKNVVRGVV